MRENGVLEEAFGPGGPWDTALGPWREVEDVDFCPECDDAARAR